jgi:ribosomal protein L11 methyltransferase
MRENIELFNVTQQTDDTSPGLGSPVLRQARKPAATGMKQRRLWSIAITTTPDAEDAVAEMLGGILCLPASAYFDLKTGMSTVTAFCEGRLQRGIRERISDGLARIKDCGLGTGAGKIVIARLCREDWAESWKRHFKPIEISDALLIKPSWSKRTARRGQAAVVLDPGLSFGTGQHPTTVFCLRQLATVAGDLRNSRGKQRTRGSQSTGTGRSLLDMGTGSGILAIAAAKLGYAPIAAFDCDADAVRVARANARLNGVAGKVRITRGDVAKLPLRSLRRYDMICANLIAPLLIAERRRLANRLRRDGTLVLAGILKAEFSGVQRAFEGLGLRCVSTRVEKEWCSGTFVFRQ